MATAKRKVHGARQTTRQVNVGADLRPLVPIVGPKPSSVPAIAGGRAEYRCVCGQRLRVFSLGHHQVYFEPGGARLEDPLIAHTCPRCERELPGSNPD
jgi:hypothetical protein